MSLSMVVSYLISCHLYQFAMFSSNVARCFSSNYGRFLRFKPKSGGKDVRTSLGVQSLEGGPIVPLAINGHDADLVELLRQGPATINNVIEEAVKQGDSVCLDDVTLLAPLVRPDKVLCVGLNYKTHCDEQKKAYPVEPFFFNKFPSTIIGPNESILHPPNTRALDWEVELAVVIGTECRQVDTSSALDHVFGYTVANDISARDWQKPTKNNGQWLFAKSMDRFCPLGPVVVAGSALGGDPQNLRLTCSVNGEQMQDGNTNDMIHSIKDIISYLSKCITLLPGDVILTGTPSGVGVFRDPRIFLKPGDTVEAQIERIGKIVNPVIEC